MKFKIGNRVVVKDGTRYNITRPGTICEVIKTKGYIDSTKYVRIKVIKLTNTTISDFGNYNNSEFNLKIKDLKLISNCKCGSYKRKDNTHHSWCLEYQNV